MNLKMGLGFGVAIIAGLVGAGVWYVNNDKGILGRYLNITPEIVKERETYSDLARRVYDSCPEELVIVPPTKIEEVLRKMNEDKLLVPGERVLIPKYCLEKNK